MLIALQQHLGLIHELVRSVATGEATEILDSGYWDWYRQGAGGSAGCRTEARLGRSSSASSFVYLAELPVHFLKIEGWMVQGLVRSPRTRQLVETIVATAKTFSMLTVAECVEDENAAQVLCDVGVDWGQGYYFSRPALASGAIVEQARSVAGETEPMKRLGGERAAGVGERRR